MPAKYVMASYAAACVVGLAGPAYAYVDPGTGSMMVQMLIAGAAAGFTTIGLYWSKLKGFLQRDRRTKPSDPD
jgi:hypothetical protein